MSKVAIVTGASRGIGAATAALLAARGYAVAVNYHESRDKAEKLVEAIIKKGGKAVAVQADMGNEEDILRLFEKTERELGPINALVNNAGINPSGTIEKISWDNVESMFRINLFGIFIACREALKYMKRAEGGSIVNVSSEAARFGGVNMAHYAACKAAVNIFTVAFAREAGPHNIRVNAISPGVIDTDMHKDISAERLASLKASLPTGRMGKSEEAAEAIAWLLSDAASFVSGAILPVAGGR